MLIDIFLKLLTAPLISVFKLIDTFTFTIPVGVFNGLVTLAKDLGYLFPISAIVPIIGIKLGLRILSFSWSVILKIKSFIPTMGD